MNVLASFRTISMIMLFLAHANVLVIGKGVYFVTLFIILSGFFSVYTFKGDCCQKVTICEMLKYGVMKIIKFYPLI